jgi:hypothetical protein
MSDSGNGLFAYPRGLPGRDRLPPEKLPCPADVNSKLLKLQMDFGIGHSNKMMVFISLATKSRPGRDRLPPEKLPCPADVIGHSNKMMVFIS